MELLARWLEAIAFVAGLMSLALGFLAVVTTTPRHIDARRRADLGDKWWHEA